MTTERYIKGPGIEVASGLNEKLITKQVLFNALYAHYTKYDEKNPMLVKKENGHCVVPTLGSHMLFKPAETLGDLTVQRELELTRELLDQYFVPRLPSERNYFYSLKVSPILIGETDDTIDYAVDMDVVRSDLCTYSEFVDSRFNPHTTLTRGELAKNIFELFLLNSEFYFYDAFRRAPLTPEQDELYRPLVHKGQQLLKFLRDHPNQVRETPNDALNPQVFEKLFLELIDDLNYEARDIHLDHSGLKRTERYLIVSCNKQV